MASKNSLEIAQQISNEQNHQHQSESAAAPDWAPVGIPAAANQKYEQNNNDDECHTTGYALAMPRTNLT